MTRSILIAAAFSIAALVAGAANAQTREDAQVSVSAAHVDFNSARQTRAFYNKLTAAAKNVCHSEISDPMTQMADEACARQAVSEAVREINAPQLSALAGEAVNASAYAMNDRQH